MCHRIKLVAQLGLCLTVMRGSELLANDSQALSDEEKRAGFVLLFNGRDLSGWKRDVGTWKVDDSSIVAAEDAQPGGKIVYERRKLPADFELRFQWRNSPSHAKHQGDDNPSLLDLEAGFSITDYTIPVQHTIGSTNQLSYFIQESFVYRVGATELVVSTGEFPIAQRREPGSKSYSGGLCRDLGKQANALGQWNDGRIICKDNVIIHWINGVKVVDINLQELKDKPRSARLFDQWVEWKARGLRLEINSGEFPVWFRSIRVRQVPKDEAIEHTTIPEDEAEPSQTMLWSSAFRGRAARCPGHPR